MTPSHARCSNVAVATTFAFVLAIAGITSASADAPGRGITAHIETSYLKFIIDHHFAALRMTELAAGTDRERDAKISPDEGTSPSPNFTETKAKAKLDELKSLARRNNRMQREEILTAQRFLHDWYGINYDPRMRGDSQKQIEILENAKAGRDFDHFFMEVFSRHHYLALPPTLKCLVGRDVAHFDLHRYCEDILHAQLSDIDEMRHLLCKETAVCDYVPLSGLKGRHSGGEEPAQPDTHDMTQDEEK